MLRRATTAFAVAILLAVPVAGHAALTNYLQNFESLVQTSPSALSGDGWVVYGNVFSPDHSTWYYGYGTFPAPNGTGAFCNVALGQGGPAQGAQQLVAFSDYNNGDQANGNLIEANVFQEQTIAAGDVGSTWTFQFDAKKGDLAGSSTALAFIKTLNPAAGYATTNFLTFNTTSIPSDWGTYSITIAIDPSLVGQILQFGFSNTTTHYEPSGIFYDNVWFHTGGATPAKPSTWGGLKTRYR